MPATSTLYRQKLFWVTKRYYPTTLFSKDQKFVSPLGYLQALHPTPSRSTTIPDMGVDPSYMPILISIDTSDSMIYKNPIPPHQKVHNP